MASPTACPERRPRRPRLWWNLLLLAALLALLLPGARGEDELAREEDEDEEEEAGVVRLGPKGRDTIIEITENDLRLVGGSPEGAAGGSSQQGFGSSGGQKKKRQKHHSFLPLHSEDFWGLTFTALGLMIAAGGGIGGGGILVPIYILVMGFPPKLAIPLSNVTILGGSIMNMVMNVQKRHPLADRPLVDWDLILIMEPLTIGGALAGSFLNKVLPEWILVIALVLLLGYTAQTTLEKGFKAYRKETQAQIQAAKAKSLQLSELHTQVQEAVVDEEREHLLNDAEAEAAPMRAELLAVLEEERRTPWKKVRLLVVCFIVVLALNLAKGGGSFSSPLGIVCGSLAFWTVTLSVFAWVIAISLHVRQDLIKRHYLKLKIGYKYAKGDIEWDETATIKYPCICFFAGFFAGMFGVGGGIVKGPLMLEMGVDPQVASASSACMILFTSFTATTSFFIFDLLVYDYAVWLFVIGFAFTSIGQHGLQYLMKRYNRNSYIIFSIGAVVGLSAVLMGLQSAISLWYGTGGGGGSICDAAG